MFFLLIVALALLLMIAGSTAASGEFRAGDEIVMFGAPGGWNNAAPMTVLAVETIDGLLFYEVADSASGTRLGNLPGTFIVEYRNNGGTVQLA